MVKVNNEKEAKDFINNIKNYSNIQDLQNKVNSLLKENDEGVQANIKKLIIIRGSIIESAVQIEGLLNEVISLYYKPLRLDQFNEDILNKSFLQFRSKITLVENIVKREDPEFKIVRNDFLKDLKKFVELRNSYAHYQKDVFNKEEGKNDSVEAEQIFLRLKDDLHSLANLISSIFLSSTNE